MHQDHVVPSADTSSPVIQALTLLEPFAQRILPGVLRRIARWKGLSAARRQDLLADFRQELACDCVANAAQVIGLPPPERHRRWFRLLERHHYRQQGRQTRRIDADCQLDHLADPRATSPADQVREALHLGTGLQAGAERLANGRCNLGATAERHGISHRLLRRTWEEVAARLGYGDEFLDFWRRRLGEAVLGLAVDLLRRRVPLLLWPQPAWPPPNVRARLRRIRRIREQLSVRPLPGGLRRLCGQLRRPDLQGADTPRQLLAVAARLLPGDAAVSFWQFEASAAAADFGAAARALRVARASTGAGVPQLLARARLLELRGRTAAAVGLLQRGCRRHRGDARVAASLRSLLSGMVSQSRPPSLVSQRS
jgi:hypothetical protein